MFFVILGLWEGGVLYLLARNFGFRVVCVSWIVSLEGFGKCWESSDGRCFTEFRFGRTLGGVQGTSDFRIRIGVSAAFRDSRVVEVGSMGEVFRYFRFLVW